MFSKAVRLIRSRTYDGIHYEASEVVWEKDLNMKVGPGAVARDPVSGRFLALVFSNLNTTAVQQRAVTLIAQVPPPTLAEALDTPGWAWATGTIPWIGQTTVTHDGVDAGQSGAISHGEQSWMETTVAGPGTLTFWWRVSSESGYDYLEFAE
jgi:hypothetical protein